MKSKKSIIVKNITDCLANRGEKIVSFCKECDIIPQNLYDWDDRDTVPNASVVFRIADHFGVSPRWLLTGEKKNSDGELDDQEKELLELFRELDTYPERQIVLSAARSTVAMHRSSFGKEAVEKVREETTSA